jgi:hypothetical protein
LPKLLQCRHRCLKRLRLYLSILIGWTRNHSLPLSLVCRYRCPRIAQLPLEPLSFIRSLMRIGSRRIALHFASRAVKRRHFGVHIRQPDQVDKTGFARQKDLRSSLVRAASLSR